VSGCDCQVNKHQIYGRGLTNACARSYKDGAFTDLTITCGPLTFPVHVVVVCSSCDFFRKSLSFAAGREAEERRIDLPEDDPEMIRRLIAYLYLGDYDPCDGLSISRYASLRQHESAIPLPENHHPRYRNGTFGSVTFASDHCACLAPNPRDISQPVSCNSASQTLPSDYKLVEKAANTVEVANPLTIHATMYALGDKYQVDGLCQLAKEKFESCLHHHAHTEDFVSAVQLAYSSTPDTNRGLRDVVLNAFRTQFKVDVKGIPGAEEKLDSIDELSFALIKSWPVKTEPVKSEPVAKVSVAVVSSSFDAAKYYCPSWILWSATPCSANSYTKPDCSIVRFDSSCTASGYAKHGPFSVCSVTPCSTSGHAQRWLFLSNGTSCAAKCWVRSVRE
jgi:hypothetical protein